VTGADILRIESRLNLPFWDFICRWADPSGAIANSYAPHFHFADEPETRFVICLRHEAAAFLPNSTKCQFLVECQPDAEHPLGLARCGIYDNRPSACRVFPTKLSESADLVVLYDVPKSTRDKGNPAYSLCPRPWDPSDVDPLQSASDLVVAKYEMSFFHHIATVWNRRPQPWDIFPDFLRLVYAERVKRAEPVQESTEEEPWLIKFPGPASQRQSRAA